jgi:Ser/Thr protein kinase RdoA (MazF antagonist)
MDLITEVELRLRPVVVMLATMMALSEIGLLSRSVTESGSSPIADVVAAAWGLPPGLAKWRRSSAAHVFVIHINDADQYLRFVPSAHRSYAEVAAAARLMRQLAERGVDVVQPVPSRRGMLAETIETQLDPMNAMLLTAAPGKQIDVDDLTIPLARSWGRALARLHRDGSDLGTDLPESFTQLAQVPDLFSDDPALAAAIAELVDRLRRLPRDPARYGLVHGDFELDNIAWDGDVATAYDFDDAARSWFAADIAFAVRDLTEGCGTPTRAHAHLFDAFIDGYRGLRPLDAAELETFSLFAGLHAAASMVGLAGVRDAGHRPDDPGWQINLRNKLDDFALHQRRIVLNAPH